MNRPSLRTAVLALSATVLLGGCDFSVYEMPLPGGADVGDDSYAVTVYFDDVLDLVPQSAVKVNEVTVGKVEDIALQGFTAKVQIRVNGDVRLPDNALAEIRQTSLLGEKFVSLTPPPGGGTGRLDQGDKIPLPRSGNNPEVEQVLGALSLLLNGGGVAQLKTITVELNNVLEGNEQSIRSLLSELDEFTGRLDRNKADIVRAIEALNRLSKSVKKQTSSITAALDRMPRALDSLDKQRDDLIKMLEALNELSDVGTRVIRASKADTVKSLESLAPILAKLADAGDALPKALQVFATYPFVDAVVGTTPAEARNLHQGDYTNLSAKLDLDLRQLLLNPPGPGPKGSNPLGDVEDQLGDLQNQLENGQDRLEDQLPGGGGPGEQLPDNPLGGAPGGSLGGSLGDGDGRQNRSRNLDGGGGGSGGGGAGSGEGSDGDDCVLGVLCRTQPGFAGNVETTSADTARLGYDPDVAALLLQGVTAR